MKFKIKARNRRQPGVMNRTEEDFSAYLERLKNAGKIIEWQFEPIRLRLAKLTTFTPDFLVTECNKTLTFYEVKGSWKAPHQDDSRAKLKIAAEMYWQFRFCSAEVITKKNGGGWKITEF